DASEAPAPQPLGEELLFLNPTGFCCSLQQKGALEQRWHPPASFLWQEVPPFPRGHCLWPRKPPQLSGSGGPSKGPSSSAPQMPAPWTQQGVLPLVLSVVLKWPPVLGLSWVYQSQEGWG
ncbi:hypothetical protein P7K49_022682, partial [Saguinus oedipus]